jgi:RHS repeat-associated protein
MRIPYLEGQKQYELDNHLGNVMITVSDRKLPVDTASLGYAQYYLANVIQAQDYYPFGMVEPGRQYAILGDSAYRFGFNGKLHDDDIWGKDNSYDYGARMYDPRLGNFLSTDALEKKSPYISPYAYTEDKPIIAKDADGNVVIFINGQNSGSGGSASYWGGYDKTFGEQLKDPSARYVDGSSGGWTNTLTHAVIGAILGDWAGAALSVMKFSNVRMAQRIAAGTAQGMKDAPDIISKLKDGETIKIVTHSMGTAYARGYVKGLLDYAAKHNLTNKVKIEYELDVNAFNSKDVPKPNKRIGVVESKTGGKQWVPETGSVPPGTKDKSTAEDAKAGHSIEGMSGFDPKKSDYKPDASKGGNPGKVEEGNNNQNVQSK